METTEKIVESYCRYVKGWFTISNIKCSGQYEIDLLATDPSKTKGINRYHIETSVSISDTYSKLTAKPFSIEKIKQRVNQASQRRTIGYFVERKFEIQEIKDELKKYGFKDGNYSKVIVSWGWDDKAEKQAEKYGLVLWDFRKILKEIATISSGSRKYFTDDTLRTIQLFVKTYNSIKTE